MATGERKWASSSTRRSGMTVLGKVAVPKPINLPSQKSENHGMDPNAEIVPKGTHSWGSRSGSTQSNPWGSSPLSMNADNGRPLSGGSGTRPSTGGSEKYESTGSNSRPSSASGTLISNQASGTTLRPHSADTRPGSSQLSRFAETSTENSGSWADAGSRDHAVHPKNENFSFGTGDFPTLGSEKEEPPKNAHLSTQGGEAVASAQINSDNVNHGRRDNPPYEDGRRPNMERWHDDAPQQNPNMHGPPQHFAPWHGAPMGVWYRGTPGAPPYVPPGVPPYGPPGAPPYGPASGPPYGASNIPPYGPLIGPGGFPIERPYYHPPMPAPPIGNSQPVPHHSSGLRGVHQNNGEMYRPSTHDGHFRPGMPMRPGFFPGPVSYDGYYPPPMGYGGPNDRDRAYLGPAGGPGVYDRHPTNAPERANSQSGSGGHAYNEKPSGPDQGMSGHRHNPHEQYKVLLKHHGEDYELGEVAAANNSQFEKGYLCRPSHEKDQGEGSLNGEKPDSRTSNERGHIRGFHTHGHGGYHFHQREGVTDVAKHTKEVSDVEKNAPDKASATENVVAPKDSGLLKKIEELNAKARGNDGTRDTPLDSNRDEGKSRSCTMSGAPYINKDSDTRYKSQGGGILSAPSFHGTEAVGGSNSSRKFSDRGPQTRTDYRGKGKSDFLETEGRHTSAHNHPFSTAASNSDPINVKVQNNRSSVAIGKPKSSFEEKDVVPDSGSVSDLIDIPTQGAKQKEIAKQRAIQLQREGEERNKEQKAKAQAKLEELNRRTKLMENSIENELTAEKTELVIKYTEVVRLKDKTASPGGKIDGKQEKTHPEQLDSAAAVLNPNTIVIGTRMLDPQLLIPKDDLHGTVTFSRHSPAEREGGYHKIDARGEPHHNVGKNNALKSKNKGYKEKQTFQHEGTASDKIVKVVADTLRYDKEAGEVSKNVIMLAEPEMHHSTKSDKSGMSKNKVFTSSSNAVRSVAPKMSDITTAPIDSGKPQSPNLAEASHGQPPFDNNASQLKEESQNRINSHSKYQSSRKQTKNQHGHNTVDRTYGNDSVVWAPVRQHNKAASENSSFIIASGGTIDHIAKSDHVQSNIKNKRAEIARYVPKPVAKELAHQGSNPQPTSPHTNIAGSAAAIVEIAAKEKHADNNHSRQAHAHGERQQRVSAEASHRKGPKDNPYDDSIASKNVSLPDSHETQEEKKLSDGWNSPDDSKTNNYKAPDASVQNFKDQESFSRGKRQFSKGTRNTGTHVHDHHRGHSQIANLNSVELERTMHKEPCHEGGHPSFHWQTRPYDSAADNRRTGAGGDSSRFVKKEPAVHGDHFQPRDVKFTITGVVSDRPRGPDRRERKIATLPIGSYSSNPNPHAQVDHPPPTEHQHERPHSSSGMRKSNNQNIRIERGKESQGEWNSFEQDKRHHNQPSVRGRHKQANWHYEYKPKGQTQGHPASADVGTFP